MGVVVAGCNMLEVSVSVANSRNVKGSRVESRTNDGERWECWHWWGSGVELTCGRAELYACIDVSHGLPITANAFLSHIVNIRCV